MGFVIENTHCMAEVSKISWWVTLISMITHPTNPSKWRYLALKKNNHDKYKDREVLCVKLNDLDWDWCDKMGFNRWLEKMKGDTK